MVVTVVVVVVTNCVRKGVASCVGGDSHKACHHSLPKQNNPTQPNPRQDPYEIARYLPTVRSRLCWLGQ
jgi:hypothetical protein